MQLRFVAGIVPAFIFFTDRLPEWQGGQARGPVVLLRPKFRNDAGLLAHELVHVKQWAIVSLLACISLAGIGHAVGGMAAALWPAGLAVHGLLYRLLPKYRLDIEAAAYREQLRHYPDDSRPLFARAIATKYDLDITADAALKLLRKP